MKAFCVLDIETTGLDTSSDYVLEIAWMFLDENLATLMEPKSFVVEQEPMNIRSIYDTIRSNDVVRNMHQESGLLGEIFGGSKSLLKIGNELYSDMMDLLQAGVETFHLTGFSVAFDRDFLRAELGFRKFFQEDGSKPVFHHQIMDLRGVRTLLELAGAPVPAPVNSRPHRALEDVRYAEEFLRESVDLVAKGQL